MRKSTPVARISASTLGSIRPGGGGGATVATSAGRFSHWAALKTVNRFRNGIAAASSPVSRARRFSSSGTNRHGERCLRRGRAPGLDPGHAAGFQLGDDLAGDFVIEARPVVA